MAEHLIVISVDALVYEDLEYMASDAFTLASAVEAQCSQFPESSMRWGSLMSESDAIWHAIVSGSRYESA